MVLRLYEVIIYFLKFYQHLSTIIEMNICHLIEKRIYFNLNLIFLLLNSLFKDYFVFHILK